MAAENWGPVVAAFNEKFPDITVETLDLGPAEVFTRYRAETGTGIASADLLVAGTIIDWIQAANDGIVVDYDTPERGSIPDWSIPMPGLFTFSADPMVTIFNKILVPEELRAKSMQEFFANIAAHPRSSGARSAATMAVSARRVDQTPSCVNTARTPGAGSRRPVP